MMDPADVHDIVAKLHRGRSRPLGRCQCQSCQTASISNRPALAALAVSLRSAAERGGDLTIDRAYVPMLLAELEKQP